MLELYHYEPSANSMKPLLCLAEKGLEYTSHYVDLHNFEQHSEEYVAINPNGQVPALIHNGAVITESTVINEYLEDVFPEVRLRPEDPVARAHMRIWSIIRRRVFLPGAQQTGLERADTADSCAAEKRGARGSAQKGSRWRSSDRNG